MANRQRGEVKIILDDKTYVMRPTFEALCEIEDALDTSIPDLILMFRDGNIRLKNIAAIVWGGIWGYDKKNALSMEEVGELITKTGMMNILGLGMDDGTNPVLQFMTYGLIGDKSIDEAEKIREVNKQKGNELVEADQPAPMTKLEKKKMGKL